MEKKISVFKNKWKGGVLMTLVPWEINKFCSPRNSVSLGFPSRKIATHKKQNKLFSEVSVLSMLYWFLPFLLRRDNTST